MAAPTSCGRNSPWRKLPAAPALTSADWATTNCASTARRSGTNYLDPAWTTFDKRDLYVTYDVTANLHRGANAVGVMLGEGWFHSRVLLLQLDIEFASGKHVTVTSGPAWKAKNGPIVSDSVWDGEVYDARLETPGWDQPGFKDDGWEPAQIVKAPGGVLSAQMMPPIQDVDSMVPIAL